jgi:hypothetical protein
MTPLTELRWPPLLVPKLVSEGHWQITLAQSGPCY